VKDPPLLKLIHTSLEPAVSVTFDHKMPTEHSALLAKYATTLALVKPTTRRPRRLSDRRCASTSPLA